MTLPNFLIIGAMKSATSSLHEMLRTHPQIFMPARKELHFFTEPQIPWEQFLQTNQPVTEAHPLLRLYAQFFQGAQPFEIAVGEATTYLSTPGVAQRIHRALPETKLICILRNPVDRAYSHFYHQMRRGEAQKRDFETVMRAQNCAHGYRTLGLYSQHLRPYFERFSARQIHILLFEDLLRDPLNEIDQIFRFLGLPPREDFRLPHSNRGWAPVFPTLNRHLIAKNPAIPFLKYFLPESKNQIKRLPPRARQFIMKRLGSRAIPPLSLDLRWQMFELFKADIRELEILIERDLSLWTPVSRSDRPQSLSQSTF
ncbi:MAG: sulfotransferase domain-containing protein [Cyanobacteria bacterium P01_F01_bin.42]